MSVLPFSLVLVSIFTHAYWNYLIKSSKNKHVFTGFSKLAEVILFVLPAIYFLSTSPFVPQFLWLIVIAACITFLNYFFLASAYKQGELSLIYPVSRASVIFLPMLAYYFAGEEIDGVGILAICLILLGTFVMHMEALDIEGLNSLWRRVRNKGSFYALLAAITVAGYTLWDKIAITKMVPFLYFYLYTAIVAIFYISFVCIRFPKSELIAEWRQNKTKIVQVGFFNSFTYLLVLTALTMSKATYVGGLRQLSIVIGAFLGYRLLGEKLNLPKIVGIIISIVGGSLIYLAN